MSDFGGLPLSAFLAALASPEPTPGGGTAAAVAGAMGASLLIMVSGLPKSRTGAIAESVALSEASARLKSVCDRFMTLANADSEAYDEVMSAYRLPKNTDDEKSARRVAVQRALTAETTTPLETLRTAGDAIALARIVAHHGNRNAASDVGVGIGLLQAAAGGAVANVRINVDGLTDESFKKAAAADVEEISRRIAVDAAAAKRALDE
jgi:formiminotetrahydrofolate cyclodeaminase